MENPKFEKLANFPSMHVEDGWICPILPSTPFATKLDPMCQKAMLLGSLSHQGLKNCWFSQKNHFLTVFIVGDFFAIFALLAMFWGWHSFLAVLTAPGWQNATWISGKTELRKLADLWQIWPYSQVQEPYSVMQSGASPGLSVGDTNDWILFLRFISNIFCLCFRSATSHPVQNTPEHRFLTQNTTFGLIKGKKNKEWYF